MEARGRQHLSYRGTSLIRNSPPPYGSEAGSYLRLMDFVYHSTLGLRVITKKKKAPIERGSRTPAPLVQGFGVGPSSARQVMSLDR